MYKLTFQNLYIKLSLTSRWITLDPSLMEKNQHSRYEKDHFSNKLMDVEIKKALRRNKIVVFRFHILKFCGEKVNLQIFHEKSPTKYFRKYKQTASVSIGSNSNK